MRQVELAPGIVLDGRRALWLPAPRVLAVADLHLGYAWAHRARGQMLPVAQGEDTLARLEALAAELDPLEIVLLGDIVHEAVPVKALANDLRRLADHHGARLRAIAGNHDRRLAEILAREKIDMPLLPSHRASGHVFEHGDRAADPESAFAESAGGRLFIGHEHPVVSLSDGAGSRVRAPVFLAGPKLVILPAFSPWAGGSEIRSGTFMSAFAQAAEFTHAYAILAGKILKMPFPRQANDRT